MLQLTEEMLVSLLEVILASTEVCERDIVEVLDGPTTATTTIPPVTLDVEPRGTSSPRISLPEGSPSHPTVTAA